jgi:hypothetical protein
MAYVKKMPLVRILDVVHNEPGWIFFARFALRISPKGQSRKIQ